MLERELGDSLPIPIEERRRQHERGIGASPCRLAERAVESGWGFAHLDGTKLDSQRGGGPAGSRQRLLEELKPLRRQGLVRVGCACYTTEEEIDRLLAALEQITG